MSFFRRRPTNTDPATPANTDQAAGGVDLDAVQTTAPDLVNLYKTAAVSLTKHGLNNQRAAVYLVLDHSLSMRTYYTDGSVQRLAEQVLALSANLDDDGIVPTVLFSTTAHTFHVSLTDYRGRVDRERGRHTMGSTNYAAAIQAVTADYRAARPAAPGFVIFQTDGEPDSRREAEQALRDAAALPIFWQFIGFGSRFDFLRHLDTMPGRPVDNAGFFAAGTNPAGIPDGALYDQLTAEFPHWLAAARTAGILR